MTLRLKISEQVCQHVQTFFCQENFAMFDARQPPSSELLELMYQEAPRLGIALTDSAIAETQQKICRGRYLPPTERKNINSSECLVSNAQIAGNRASTAILAKPVLS
jgi:hypothetical protein